LFKQNIKLRQIEWLKIYAHNFSRDVFNTLKRPLNSKEEISLMKIMHGSWRGGVSEPINIDNVKTLSQTARSALHCHWCNMILQVYIFGSMALEYKEYFTHIVL
jgi:hypothetical protein